MVEHRGASRQSHRARVVRVDRRGKCLLLELDANSLQWCTTYERSVVVDEGAAPPPHSMSLQNSTMGSECCSSTRGVEEIVVIAVVEILIPNWDDLVSILVDDVTSMTSCRCVATGGDRWGAAPRSVRDHRISNIYADEICHRQGIRPDRQAHPCRDDPAVDLLIRLSMSSKKQSTLGSTLADAQYVGVDGTGHIKIVTGSTRTGQRCMTCGRGIIHE